MGSSWALMVVVFPFQLAALLGVILLLVSAFRARRAKTDQA
jgi:hypothetical protein